MATLPFSARLFDFNGQFTRQLGTTTAATSLSDFALGAFDSRNAADSSVRSALGGRPASSPRTPGVNSRLTLTYGFRWELMAPYETSPTAGRT
jgi:hypothetical protein